MTIIGNNLSDLNFHTTNFIYLSAWLPTTWVSSELGNDFCELGHPDSDDAWYEQFLIKLLWFRIPRIDLNADSASYLGHVHWRKYQVSNSHLQDSGHCQLRWLPTNPQKINTRHIVCISMTRLYYPKSAQWYKTLVWRSYIYSFIWNSYWHN